MSDSRTLTAEIPLSLAGLRFDRAVSELFPDYSRSRLQAWIQDGSVRLDGDVKPVRFRVLGGERVVLVVEPETVVAIQPQAIPLELIYEDEQLLVVNKPAGLVVHPAVGHRDGTLQNGLLNHCPELDKVPRCGIVHRLDKDTSGLLMAAKTIEAHKSLVDQLQHRSVHREYLALVQGTMTGGGIVNEAIGRHPTDRKRFAVTRFGGKEAVTHYRLVERFIAHTLIRIRLETGRTHQIRVHMAHVQHALVGDPVYGGRQRVPPKASEGLLAALRSFTRQALHATSLGIKHPLSGEYMEWSSPIPADMSDLIDRLRAG